ncbi:flavodoxin [Enterococcus florum]|uniref:Flavodoxin n=2 Tax=Enterococcus florum TaxID=2480627 RepID=A0A4P5PAI3_9ENTE|nr:flavodoxin [Enterococcus florum]
MSCPVCPSLTGTYESIGFIYPTYFQGLPRQAERFIRQLDLSQCRCEYVYGITTFGELSGNALSQLNGLLCQKGQALHYSAKLKMFSNYVVMYDLSRKLEQKTIQADQALQHIVEDLRMKTIKQTRRNIPLLDRYYRWQIQRAQTSDRHYQISQACVSCNLCEKVCPVNNIEMHDGQPAFLNHCEQCLACVQYCPEKAINFKEKTQKRRRYHHPEIPAATLIQSNRQRQEWG